MRDRIAIDIIRLLALPLDVRGEMLPLADSSIVYDIGDGEDSTIYPLHSLIELFIYSCENGPPFPCSKLSESRLWTIRSLCVIAADIHTANTQRGAMLYEDIWTSHESGGRSVSCFDAVWYAIRQECSLLLDHEGITPEIDIDDVRILLSPLRMKTGTAP